MQAIFLHNKAKLLVKKLNNYERFIIIV